MSFFNELNKNFFVNILYVTPINIPIKKKKITYLKNYNFLKIIKNIIKNKLLMYLVKSSLNFTKYLINKKNIQNIDKIIKNKNTLLENIKKNIMFDQTKRKKILKTDNSILIFSCCSKYKEIEILYKNIKKILKKKNNICANDIVIVSTKIKKYLPYINSIFHSKNILKIPYTIISDNKCKIKKFLNFVYRIFDLKKNKITIEEIIYFLYSDFIKKKYKIKNEEIILLERYIKDMCVKFDIENITFKKKLKKISKENTWNYALKKILLGYTTYNKNLIYKNYVPYIKINYCNKNLISKFIKIITIIKKWKKIFSKKKKLSEWKDILNNIFKKFLKKNEKKINIKLLFKNIIKLGINIKYKNKIYSDELKIIFKKFIKLKYYKNDIFLNSVTFCNLHEIENINFKVIYFLGIHYYKIKNQNLCKNFNLLHKNKNYYYKEKYKNIRKIILLIISAEKYFYISYTNNFNENNNIKILEILINYISKHYYFKKKLLKNFIINKKDIISRILKEYKQDISYKNYEKIKKNKNKNKNIKLKKKKHKKNKINILNLITFWKNPIKYFLKKIIKINLFEYKNIYSEKEAFTLTKSLENKISNDIFKNILKNKNTKKIFKYYLSLGILPKKHFGKIIFEEIVQKSKILKKNIYKLNVEKKIKKIKIKIKIKNFIIKTKIKTFSQKKLISYKPKILNLNDIIEFWFYHLFFCATYKCKKHSKMLGYKNSIIIFKKLSKKESYYYIIKYIHGYLDGIKNPIFLTKSGMIWIKNLIKKKNKKISKKIFIKNWNGNNYIFGEKNNLYIKKIISKTNTENIQKIYLSSLKWHYPILKKLKKYKK
ncbi:hypothetical protein RJD44_01510 [Buchnera aphidicola (Astegopteryx bambusae)]|uniref:hypothetical protein n=1 Tax=Buchnera aphidicola TaxID=9 RepID=UPI0031B8406C